MWDVCRQIFQNHFVGDDRATPDEKPPVLRRPTIYFCALLVIGLVAFATLMPVHQAGWNSPKIPTFSLGWYRSGPVDVLLNLAMYIPVGLLLRLALRRRDRAGLSEIPKAVFLAAGLSLTTEYLQQSIAFRVASLTDVMVNIMGALVGAAVAPRCQMYFRNAHALLFYAIRHRPFRTVTRFATVLIFASLWAPFDFHAGFQEELRRAKWTPTPPEFYFSGAQVLGSFEDPYQDPLNDAGTFGAFLLLGLTLCLSARESRLGESAVIGRGVMSLAVIALFVECGQLFFAAHTFDVWDICVALVSGSLGIAMGRKIQCDPGIGPGAPHRIICPESLIGLALLFQVAYLMLRGFAPFYFGMKGHEFEAWFWVPFEGEIFRGRFGLLGDSVQETFRYLAAAFLLILYMDFHLQEVRGWHVCGFLLCVVGLGELYQIFLADRYADTTTPVLVIAASWTMVVAYRAVVIDLHNGSALACRLQHRSHSLIESFRLIRRVEQPVA